MTPLTSFTEERAQLVWCKVAVNANSVFPVSAFQSKSLAGETSIFKKFLQPGTSAINKSNGPTSGQTFLALACGGKDKQEVSKEIISRSSKCNV